MKRFSGKTSAKLGRTPLSAAGIAREICSEAVKADRLAAMACFLMMTVPFVMFVITLIGIYSSRTFGEAGFDIVWLPVIETLPFTMVGGGLLFLNRRLRLIRKSGFEALAED